MTNKKENNIAKKASTNKPQTSKATTPRAKPITLSQNRKEYNKLSKWSTYVLDPESNMVIKYKEKFDKHEVEEVLQEAYKSLIEVNEKGYDFFKDDMEFMRYIHLLIIKKFTHLGDQIPDSIEEQGFILKEIVATGLFETIFAFVLDPEEVVGVLDKFQEMVGLIEKIGNLTTETQKELAETLVNQEIISSAFNKNNPIHPLVDPYGDGNNGKV